jgi:hypothetical protein
LIINGKEIEVEKLHEKVWVFKNALSNSNEMLEYYLSNYEDKSVPWYTFGFHILIPTSRGYFESFPSKDDWQKFMDENFSDKEIGITNNEYVKDLFKVFHESSVQYFGSVKVDYDNWCWDSVDIAYYKDGMGVNDFQGMNYHTDFQEERREDPGLKFGTTCLFYLNDDYEDGGVNIIELSDDKEDLLSHVYYKPNAGDLIMFPSGHPFYHSPMIAKGGSKALIRAYWRYEYPGSEAWHSEKAQHSEEEWTEILRERHKEGSYNQGRSLNKWNEKIIENGWNKNLIKKEV